MKRSRNGMQMKLKAWARQGLELQTPNELDAVPAPAAISDTSTESSFWNPFRLDRYDADDEWLSRIQSLSGNLGDLANLMRIELDHQSWLNAYLLSSGMGQIIEDHLHSDPFLLGRAARFFGKSSSVSGRNAAALTLGLAQAWSVVNEMLPGTRRESRYNKRQADYTSALASNVMDSSPAGVMVSTSLTRQGIELVNAIPQLPRSLLKELNRLPSCFRSFDQSLEDVRELAKRFSTRWPDKTRAIGIVGVRTSGSYLAPLYQAALSELGYTNVHWLTIRPGTPLMSHERAFFRRLARNGGLAVICDDPPNTGDTLLKVVNTLQRRGIARENTILLLQLFEGMNHPPEALRGLQNVSLAWDEWNIQKQLREDAVRIELGAALQPNLQISRVQRLPIPTEFNLRRHAKALYRLNLDDTTTGEEHSRDIAVKGVGLGYFGEHHLAVSRKLPDFSARIILLKNGLVYEEVPVKLRGVSFDDFAHQPALLNTMTDYVVRRNIQLPVDVDLSLQLNSRNAVWEVASGLLSQSFGKAWYLLRIPLVDKQVKKNLWVPGPSVIDGDMGLQHWFIREGLGGENMIKTNLAERDFSHEDLSTFDPAYDLAALTLACNMQNQSASIRGYYLEQTGDEISLERWMLHQLVRIWDLKRHAILTADETRAKMSGVLERYFSDLYFSGLPIRRNGPICVLDLDGVLETNPLGFASLTSASARSLSALNAHGYPVLIASGRSLAEVKARCSAYRLAGGVAEYGSALFDSASGREGSLLDQSEQETLQKVRGLLGSMSGVSIDSGYTNSLRAFHRDRDGNRKALDFKLVSALLEEHGYSQLLTVIPGVAQTDIVVNRIDKGTGVKTWIEMFGGNSAHAGLDAAQASIALAVGDGLPDLPVLQMAGHAFAPAHAPKELKQARVAFTAHPYQRGLEQAVTALLGHRPGDCPTCQLRTFSPESEYLQDILSVQEDGKFGMIIRSINLLVKKGKHSYVGTN